MSSIQTDAGDDDAALAHAVAAREMLEHGDKSDDSVLNLLYTAGSVCCHCYSVKKQFDAADYHCEQSLMFARLEHQVSLKH